VIAQKRSSNFRGASRGEEESRLTPKEGRKDGLEEKTPVLIRRNF